jgi:hypothetical protein
LIAEMIPIGMPIRSQQTAPPSASDAVAGRRSKIVSRTSMLFWYERPKLKWNTSSFM